MFLTRLYYRFKPFIPKAARTSIRRYYARRILRRCSDVWPINEAAGARPKGWPGWPEGKRFAFVLTHDVETRRGLDRVKQLAELEMSLGFRSSFNFIPEGDYEVPLELRSWLTERGFEVGVHDLHHDGKLYWSRASFQKKAKRINYYLKEWGGAGFRSAFMLRNLAWIQDLNIVYDASTFDTDPFEPQSDGAATIFPFWVPDSTRTPSQETQSHSTGSSRTRTGYVELPYTLAQDSTLFVILQEKGIGIWRRKLDWIVEKGGMALLDTHPDYMNFEGDNRSSAFPSQRYREFLIGIQSTHCGEFWHALPREVATYYKQALQKPPSARIREAHP